MQRKEVEGRGMTLSVEEEEAAGWGGRARERQGGQWRLHNEVAEGGPSRGMSQCDPPSLSRSLPPLCWRKMSPHFASASRGERGWRGCSGVMS